jgi:hypothetical protein
VKHPLDIKHRVRNIRVGNHTTLIRHLLHALSARHTGSRSRRGRRFELVAQVAARTGTHQIGIVRRRTDADGLGGASEHVAEIVGKFLQGVRGAEIAWSAGFASVEDLIPDGEVVGWTRGSLQSCVGLQVEVPVAGFGDAAVDNCARLRVMRLEVGFVSLCRVETGVVAFPDDHYSDAREALLRGRSRVGGIACLAQERKLCIDNSVVLAF